MRRIHMFTTQGRDHYSEYYLHPNGLWTKEQYRGGTVVQRDQDWVYIGSINPAENPAWEVAKQGLHIDRLMGQLRERKLFGVKPPPGFVPSFRTGYQPLGFNGISAGRKYRWGALRGVKEYGEITIGAKINNLRRPDLAEREQWLQADFSDVPDVPEL